RPPRRVRPAAAGNPIGGVMRVSELDVVYLFLSLLALFVVIGALLPRYLPGLIRRLDTTVLKENKDEAPH
ncbi:MAG TPA: hypothetical protein VFH63_08060, partial [candidate division Zixibacteria bacterium]|nr:hypothetical protein [candidate division Zixibacteria bacterium]